MKKLLRIAVVLCLAMALSVTAFAANASENGTGASIAVDSNGKEVAMTVTAPTVTPTAADAATAIKSDDVKAEDLSVVWVRDITAAIPAGGSVTITFEVPGATADDTVFVLHYENGAWVTVATCKGNDVKAVFTSLSPVALVLEKAAAAPSTPSKPSSPTTGEEPVLLAAIAVALLAGAVAVVALKKKEEM